MLVHVEKYQHSYPYCWRSKTPIVFRAVKQFFIRIDDLRGPALAAVKDATWLPPWGEARISGTVESRPDWVISRQRSWGVPLPVFYTPEGEAILDAETIRKLADLVAQRGSNVWFELNDEQLARELGLPEGTTHRNDTIDVWIDSGVSHKAVCAARPELRDPADMYLEATDQHRGWFQSSLMTSVALHNRAPYKTCVTHGFVVDVDGKKISKSSSYSKPMDAGHFVGKHGADIVRLWVSSVNYTDDVPFSEEMFTRLGDTYRRIRNTLRILLGNLHGFESGTQESRKAEVYDRRSLDSPSAAAGRARVPRGLRGLRIPSRLPHAEPVLRGRSQQPLRRYHEGPDVLRRDPRRRAASRRRLRCARSSKALTRLLAPILVFTAEEAWGYLGQGGSIHLQQFPAPDDRRLDEAAGRAVSELLKLRGIIGQAVEQARQEKVIGNALEAAVVLRADEKLLAGISHDELEEFFILSDLTIEPAAEPSASITRTPARKCSRCWRHRRSVGTHAEHPELCDRCASVIHTVATTELAM